MPFENLINKTRCFGLLWIVFYSKYKKPAARYSGKQPVLLADFVVLYVGVVSIVNYVILVLIIGCSTLEMH
jgi:hypothetical protein